MSHFTAKMHQIRGFTRRGRDAFEIQWFRSLYCKFTAEWILSERFWKVGQYL